MSETPHPTRLQPGNVAPAFRAPSTDGTTSLEDYRGRWLVLYFYPKDATPGCTTQACDFRDALPGLDAAVLGVSPDPIDSHDAFRSEHSLPFPLLSDTDHAIATSYGAWGEKSMYGKTFEGILRSTFVIDPDGVIRDAMYNVKATGHVERVRERLAALQAAPA